MSEGNHDDNKMEEGDSATLGKEDETGAPPSRSSQTEYVAWPPKELWDEIMGIDGTPEPKAHQPQEREASAEGEYPIKTALVVEDEAGLVPVLNLLLQREGIQATACDTGEDGLENLRRGEYDLLITDWGLAKNLDGFGMVEAARAEGKLPPRVMMLTGQKEAAEERNIPDQEGKKPIRWILGKPFDAQQFRDTIVEARKVPPAPQV